MATIKGEIAFLDAKSGTSRAGKPYTLFSLKIKQEDGTLSEKIDCGFERPPFEKGAYVEVAHSKNDKGYEKLDFIKAADRPAAKVATSTAGAAGTANAVGGGSVAEGVADRQTSIVMQHSQEMAIAEVGLLLAHDALPVSAANTKAGAAKRYSEIIAAIQKRTVAHYVDAVTARLLDTVQDEGVVSVEADGPIPAAAEATAESDE